MTVAVSTIWLLVAALLAGSFFGVVVARFARPMSILWGRSQCDACGQTLGPRDLVPLLSWLWSRGRCRYCAARIGLFYPGFELGAFAIALWSVYLTSGWLVWASAFFGWVLLTLAVIDARHFLLPDFLTLPLIPLGLAVNAALLPTSLVPALIGAVAGYLFVVVLRLIYQRLRGLDAIGLGDAKLLAAAGAWVGWQGLPSVVMIAACTGLATVGLLRLTRGVSLSLQDRVPFGTFLCLGTWIIWLYGPLA